MSLKRVVNHDEMIPMKFHLSQNYPNPFKESTIIKYCISIKSKVTIRVFNKYQEIIAQIIDDVQEAGTYEVKFNGQTFSGGEYLYIMEAFGISSGSKKIFSDTRKMILLK